ncbi:MAG: lysophospholipid acyltransferase family protein, partial [Betaproteobacteria bacterium]
LMMAACRRPIRFLVDERLLKKPLLGFVLRQSRAIPLPPEGNAAAQAAACLTAAEALAAGELIGVFPEGTPTPDGELRPFQPIVEQIVGDSGAPVVPLALRGMWESPFSQQPGSRLARTRARAFSAHVTLASAPAVVAGEARASSLHGAVGALLVS